MTLLRNCMLLFALGIVGVGLGVRHSQAEGVQSGDSKLVDIKVAPTTMWDAAWITKVSIGNQFLIAPYNPNVSPQPNQVVPGQNFIAQSDWLRNMKLLVTNRTEKPIAWLSVSLKFPQTGNGITQPVWVYQMQIGRMPDAAAFDKNGKPLPDTAKGVAPLALLPGQTMTISVADYIEKIEAYLKSASPLSALTECYVSIDSVELDDGQRWAGGGYSAPDVNRHGQWVSQTRGYFPGDPHKHLPNVIRRPGESPQL